MRRFALTQLVLIVTFSGLVFVAAAVARSEENPRPKKRPGAPARHEAREGPEGQEGIVIRIKEAQEGKDGAVIRIGDDAGYWIGLALEALDEEDREEAKLRKGQGLEVEQVVPDSPAAKAGFEPDDIVLVVNGRGIGNLAQLSQLVQESAGKPMEFVVLRDGKKKTIKVTPAKRPGPRTVFLLGEGEEREVHEARRRKPGETKHGEKEGETAKFRWQPLKLSGTLKLGEKEEVPDDLEITIKKKGDQPARIKVTQGHQSWKIKASELNELPEAIRRHVARMLPGGGGLRFSLNAPQQPRVIVRNVAPAGGALLPGAPLPGSSRRANPSDQTQREIQQLKHRLHELEEQVEALRAKKER